MPERHNLRHSRIWIWAAVLVAVLGGLAYYFGSTATQPSLVSDEGGELMAPEEVEDEILETPNPNP